MTNVLKSKKLHKHVQRRDEAEKTVKLSPRVKLERYLILTGIKRFWPAKNYSVWS